MSVGDRSGIPPTMMGLPKFDLDIATTVAEFLTLLRNIDAKLDKLIEIERDNQRAA